MNYYLVQIQNDEMVSRIEFISDLNSWIGVECVEAWQINSLFAAQLSQQPRCMFECCFARYERDSCLGLLR